MSTSSKRLIHLVVIMITTALLWIVQQVWIDKDFSYKRFVFILIGAFFAADLFVKLCFKKDVFFFSKDIDYEVKMRLLGWFRKARKLPLWSFIFFGVIWRIATACILAISTVALDIQDEIPDITRLIGNSSIGVVAMAGLLAAPLLESLLFQLIPVELSVLVSRKSRYEKNYLFAIVVSALAFGLDHTYSPLYAVMVFLIGLYLAFVYVLFTKATGKRLYGYLATTSTHLLMNLIAFGIVLLKNAF